jgi:NAD(P)-dependent dehydrogenase (short-subunit alcohol dehydrogenase family)
MLERLRLDGRVAIITGGGSGLGRAMALAFAGAGAVEISIAQRPRRLRVMVALPTQPQRVTDQAVLGAIERRHVHGDHVVLRTRERAIRKGQPASCSEDRRQEVGA